MGEKSKLIGEFGEKSVENFLEIIGWTNTLKGVQFDCIEPEHEKKTHGLDFAFLYHSPLVDHVLKKIHISVKFTDKPYPNSPKSKFKAYFEDLVASIDCFRFSSEHKNWVQSIKGFTKSENIGVLFWLSNDEDTYADLIEKVNNTVVPTSFEYDQVYLVDNQRVEFLYQSIHYTRKFKEEYFYSFFYPETGKNINPSIKQDHGQILPIEYLNSSLLPIRLEAKIGSETKLLLFSIDAFDVNDLKRLINLAQTLSKSWTNEVILGFPNYNESRHVKDVNIAKSSFEKSNITERIRVVNYLNSFRNLQEEKHEK